MGEVVTLDSNGQSRRDITGPQTGSETVDTTTAAGETTVSFTFIEGNGGTFDPGSTPCVLEYIAENTGDPAGNGHCFVDLVEITSSTTHIRYCGETFLSLPVGDTYTVNKTGTPGSSSQCDAGKVRNPGSPGQFCPQLSDVDDETQTWAVSVWGYDEENPLTQITNIPEHLFPSNDERVAAAANRIQNQQQEQFDQVIEVGDEFINNVVVPGSIAVVSGTVAGFVGNELSDML